MKSIQGFKYLAGKDYVTKKLKCITTLIRPKSFWDFQWERIVFNFYFVVKQENAERRCYQDIIQLLQKQGKESSSLCSDDSFPSLLEVLQKASNPLYVN